MKTLTLVITLAACLFAAESKPEPSIPALQAEIVALRARLSLALQNVEIEKASCMATIAKRDEFSALPDVMRTRLAAVDADAKLKAAQDPKPKQ